MQGGQRRVGRFELGPVIGQGGMGVVHRARDTDLRRDVALKLIAPSLAHDMEFRARFEAEARAAASVDHANVLPIFEAGEDGGELYLAMRLVEGTDLKAVLAREGRLPASRAAAIVAQIAAALDAAHARGLVHRDVKPANALIVAGGGEDHVYLTDFGLTQIEGGSGHVTNPGQVLGTANYMAPEQIRGGTLDGRVDVYALACVAFECLVGAPPFARDTVAATLDAHLHEEVQSAAARAPSLPPAVDDALAGGLAKDPAQRFASCGAFARAFGASLGTDSGEVPRDPRVATRARPQPIRARPAPPPAPAQAPTAVLARPRRGRTGRILATMLALLATAGIAVAAALLLPSLLDGDEGGAGLEATLPVLSRAQAVNAEISAMISRLALDPAGEAERDAQSGRLPGLRAEVRRLRAATRRAVDPTARPLLFSALATQERLIGQYGAILRATPESAIPLIEEMTATLAQAEVDLSRAGRSP